MGKMRIACEVSVTSTRDQEFGNIEKCLAAGFDRVMLVTSQRRHCNTIKKFVLPHQKPDANERVYFLLQEKFMDCLSGFAVTQATSEETVRGNKVKVTHQVLSEHEAHERRRAITKVIARSLKELRKE